MVRKLFNNLAKVLLVDGKQSLDFTQYAVSKGLVRHIHYRARDSSEVPINPGVQSQERGTELLASFKSHTRQQCTERASPLAHTDALPIHPELKYIKSLLKSGLKREALSRWRLRAQLSGSDSEQWIKLGVKCLCRCNHVVAAEKLMEANPSIVDPEVCLSFIRAYSALGSKSKTEAWCTRMFQFDLSSSISNAVLQLVVSARMWREAQFVIKLMSQKKVAINTQLVARCIASIDESLSPRDLAQLLRESGGLVNNPIFKNVLVPDVRTQLSALLRSGEVQKARDLVVSYEGPYDISLSYQYLQYYKNAARLGSNIHSEPELLQSVLEKVEGSPSKSSLYVQFMLSFYQHSGNYAGLWHFMKKHKLFTSNPSIQGKLSHSNYLLIWRLLHEFLRTRCEQTSYTGQLEPPVSFRDFTVTTINATAPTSNLLKQVMLCLNTIPDVPALVSLVKYASERSGSFPEDSQMVYELSGYPLEFFKAETFDFSRFIMSVCEKHSLDMLHILEQSAPYSSALGVYDRM